MTDREELRTLPLFGGLNDEQLDELVAAGADVPFGAGEVIFHEGDHADAWWVLLDGSLELVRYVARQEVVVGRFDVPGRWAGGFRAWDDHGVYLATARGMAPGRTLRVPAAELGALSARWFPFASHLIAGIYGTARSIEATARQRSALATLGTLAAGLAHEINNPASAATRASAELATACDRLLDALQGMAAAALTAEEFMVVDTLRGELTPPTVRPGGLDLADREEAVVAWLLDRGVEDSWGRGASLASAGADVRWCERASGALPGAALSSAVAWVASTVDVASLLASVRESTHRVSELVTAMKDYSQMDRAPSQRFDVHDGLESTLLIMAPRLRGGVEVVREWAEGVPQVDGMPGELNQVWTNLVSNALDAMEGAGTLTVRTRTVGDSVVVEVGDTGPGLSQDILDRAFEPFFTTKDVGRGSGLGLDIARRIVEERHGGSIAVESVPGHTVFRVSLPAAAAAGERTPGG